MNRHTNGWYVCGGSSFISIHAFSLLNQTHLTKTLKQSTTSLKIPLLRLQPCSLPLRHGKGNVALERDGMNSPLESLEFKVRDEDRACWKTPPRADSSQWSRHNSPSDTTPHANQPLKYMMTAQRTVTLSDRPDTKQLWGHTHNTQQKWKINREYNFQCLVWMNALTLIVFVGAKMFLFSHIHSQKAIHLHCWLLRKFHSQYFHPIVCLN